MQNILDTTFIQVFLLIMVGAGGIVIGQVISKGLGLSKNSKNDNGNGKVCAEHSALVKCCARIETKLDGHISFHKTNEQQETLKEILDRLPIKAT